MDALSVRNKNRRSFISLLKSTGDAENTDLRNTCAMKMHQIIDATLPHSNSIVLRDVLHRTDVSQGKA